MQPKSDENFALKGQAVLPVQIGRGDGQRSVADQPKYPVGVVIIASIGVHRVPQAEIHMTGAPHSTADQMDEHLSLGILFPPGKKR